MIGTGMRDRERRDADTVAALADAFLARYGDVPEWIVRAPGRVNLIGDHTDYNDGFVLPMAIDRAVWIALRSRVDDEVETRSLEFTEPVAFSLASLATRDDMAVRESGWGAYVRGIAWAMREAGIPLRGWEGVVSGDVPLGAGLSSSAALELAVAHAFTVTAGVPWSPIVMAATAQRAENEWVGVQCGIMDQLISGSGVAGHALRIDCRTLEMRPVPIHDTVAVVVLDTATRRGLVDSEYNQRRAQCREAAAAFRVATLRDVDLETFEAESGKLSPIVRRRARHVITENVRVLTAADALTVHDLAGVGRLMNESHASLRDDFEVSNDALDAIVDAAQSHPACYGARMTGAGFGGCAVALVDAEAVAGFSATVAEVYAQRLGRTATITRCLPAAGAQAVRTPKR